MTDGQREPEGGAPPGGVRAIFPSDDPARPGWLVGEGFRGLIQAHRPEQVRGALAAVDSAVGEGLWAAGFVSYEAAVGLDPHCAVHPPTELPLVWFSLFERLAHREALPPTVGDCTVGPWQPTVTPEQFRAAIARIKEWIAAGDTYQVNYTHRLRGPFAGEPLALFARLYGAQRAGQGAYIDTGRFALCSASPELFFRLAGDRLVSRPMKGTARRGLWARHDVVARRRLARSAKDRAENAMIADMVRNDMGRIARRASVAVRDAFAIEAWPTVLQMTTTVEARTDADLPALFEAMFPCASITGAPKLRTMQIIRQLEPDARGVYTGSIGWVGPGRRVHFNVAIRTVTLDRSTGQAEYGLGGGIVWDSQPDAEYAECQTKRAVLAAEPEGPFELLETLRYEPAEGYWLLQGHLERLAASAEYFGWPCDRQAVRAALDKQAQALTAPARVRLRLSESGSVHIEAFPAPPRNPPGPWRLRLARTPVDSRNRLLYHKTTARGLYDAALAQRGDCDDVLLWNERGELTETALANIVLEFAGQRFTPPIHSGLLPGVLRSALLGAGEIRPRILTRDDLARCDRLYAINSLRGWMPARLEPPQ